MHRIGRTGRAGAAGHAISPGGGRRGQAHQGHRAADQAEHPASRCPVFEASRETLRQHRPRHGAPLRKGPVIRASSAVRPARKVKARANARRRPFWSNGANAGGGRGGNGGKPQAVSVRIKAQPNRPRPVVPAAPAITSKRLGSQAPGCSDFARKARQSGGLLSSGWS